MGDYNIRSREVETETETERLRIFELTTGRIC